MTEKKKEQIEGDFKINDDGNRTFGRGFDVVVKAVAVQSDGEPELIGDLDGERDVTDLFKNSEGYCLICELWCGKANCTKCEVPKFSEKITTEVMRSITSHKGADMNSPLRECVRKTMVMKKSDGKEE